MKSNRSGTKAALRIVFLCAGLLVTAAYTAAADTAAVLGEFDAYLDTTAAQLGNSPFAAVVSRDGEIIYERYHDGGGVLGSPVNAESRWQVYSITKSFTAALVLKLCQDGLLTLDDPVGKFVPAFLEHGGGEFDRRDVKIRHLMSHTSGAAVDGDKTPESLPPGFESIDIITEPGIDYEYSGLGMLILERAIEAATGEDFEDLLNRNIIKPLGLEATGYVYAGLASDRVLPLEKGQFQYSQVGRRAGEGLYTNARDLNAFGRFWLGPDPMFSKALRQEAWTWHGTRASDQGRYGLMWWLFEDEGGYVMSGRENKINAVVPETGVVVTVIRYPQDRPAEGYRFIDDKRAMVLFGKRLGKHPESPARGQSQVPESSESTSGSLSRFTLALDSDPTIAIEEIVEERGTADTPDRKVSGISVPTITVHRAPAETNTGTAVVICPGGGYSGEAIDKEGHDIARYLTSIGVTGIVLKYRLPLPGSPGLSRDFPSQDAARAIRLARHHAADWGLDPDRVGIMGFSAGGHLASTIATRFDAGNPVSADPVERFSSRPDFQVLVYPVISFTEAVGHSGSRKRLLGDDPSPGLVDRYSNELHVTANTPPAFLVSTDDDHVKAENSLLYYQALRAAGVPAELHIYEIGGHGYGIRPTGNPVATWHHRMSEWMARRGLLERH